MNTKFRGKYLQISPVGTCHLVFRRTGHHFTWQKISMTVHNIIVGRLWIDNSGEMDIVNHNTGEKCHLSFKAYSYFSSEPARGVSSVPWVTWRCVLLCSVCLWVDRSCLCNGGGKASFHPCYVDRFGKQRCQ